MVVVVEDLPRLLAKPESYSHSPARVEVCETHISWVFLAGDRAYKLKKPIVLTFLDYGTAAHRRKSCREEVRLNRRLAPDVYLGVRGVVVTPDGVGLGAESEPDALDYVVEMRRYEEANTLASALDRGELELDDIDRLADRLRRFHGRARRVTSTQPWDVVLERRLQRNLHELLDCVDQRMELERVLAIERFTHAFLRAHSDLIRARGREGRVRECHGDLRAEHVLLGGHIEIVDCIEFDPALRELDVADELAFLISDLTRRGGERFGRRLISSYRRGRGDPGPDRLIAFYCVYRALVRAKVELLTAAEHEAGSAAHGHHSAAARDLVGLAERFVWRARLPLAIVVCGVPASGKTSLARALADAAQLPHISSDVTRKRLAGLRPAEAAPGEAYSEGFNVLTYAELGRQASRELAACGGVVVDGTFRHRIDRQAFRRAFGGVAPVLFVECRAPADVLAQRGHGRDRGARGASDADLAVVLRERSVWDPLDEVTADAHVMLRTDRRVPAVMADLASLLDERIDPLAGEDSS